MSQPSRLKAVFAGAFGGAPFLAAGIFFGAILVGLSPEFDLTSPATSLDEGPVYSVPTRLIVAAGSLFAATLPALAFRSSRQNFVTYMAVALAVVAGLHVATDFGAYLYQPYWGDLPAPQR